MAKLSTLHDAITRAALGLKHAPGDRVVCSSKVPADLGARADTILKHEGTTLNAYLGACLTLLVEDYENATREA